jgi:hypothetical protein
MKDHFVKIAVTLIGKDKSMEIIRHICMEKKIPSRQMRKLQKEILSCDYIQLKEQEYNPVKINELNYVK